MPTYAGSFEIFDYSRIRRYPIATRPNKVKLADLIKPEEVLAGPLTFDSPELRTVAERLCEAVRLGQPVIWFTGGHLIKNGLGPLVIDLIERGVIGHYAMNGAAAIHDFELAMVGETSENVPNALPEGKFGLAYETGRYLNLAINQGFERGWGMGEAIARFILGETAGEGVAFPHRNYSVTARAFRKGIPVTVHVGVGADILHEHPEFDGAATGATSGWDFGVFAATVCRMTEGGVFINVGSAVMGPEVLLKSVSMAANVGRAPRGLVTADFDFRPVDFGDVYNEDRPGYYFRDIKSIVSRIPQAFGGVGYYVRGDQRKTIPALYKLLVESLS